MDLVPAEGGRFAMSINGMSSKQQKDAVAVATSSLRYFACPEGQTGVLLDRPAFSSGTWKMSARCG